jgi:hypothetical protein
MTRQAAYEYMQELVKKYVKGPKPEQFTAELSKGATARCLADLRNELHGSFISWTRKFLEAGGLPILLEQINQVSRSVRDLPAFSTRENVDILFQLLRCLSEIMNSQIGLTR